MVLTTRQQAALDRSISPDRMSTYTGAALGDAAVARELYLWDRELSVAFLADLAVLEVALRNAMNEQLTNEWGADWYAQRRVPLDDRSVRQLADAWSRITGPKTHGRLVAQCMFGFWRGLLDRGDHLGRAPRRERCDYEVLWRGVLSKAFPGGRAVAGADGLRWDRAYALAVVSRVNDPRNRVAHHEPLINGFPLSGQRRRRTAAEARADCLRLAAMLDRDLHALLIATSRVDEILARRPEV